MSNEKLNNLDTYPKELIVKGAFVKKRWMKCPHMDKKCGWRMGECHHKGYEYLNNSCYLSGGSELQCP